MTVVAVYASATVVGLVALVGWILTAALAGARDAGFDPEERFGVGGRRVVAGVTAFGLGGMAAAFSPLDPAPLLEGAAAVVAAAGAVWYAGRPGAEG